ncbi:MAG TPA: hypothetical protein VFK54_12035 [Candidatus Limnocylindrales bacterium]|nr:hypothetical protein [Candidatus Limnocylindrales bacterium]
MRRALIAFGTLGGGTLIAFVLAALAFLADPTGRLVPVAGGPIAVMRGQAVVDRAMPLPMPAAEDAVVGVGAAPAPVVIDEAIEKELARDAGG